MVDGLVVNGQSVGKFASTRQEPHTAWNRNVSQALKVAREREAFRRIRIDDVFARGGVEDDLEVGRPD